MLRAAIAVLALAAMIAPAGEANAQAPLVASEDATVESPQTGLKIYVRNKPRAAMSEWTPDKTLVFVHGATYPSSTSSTSSSAVCPGWILSPSAGSTCI
jgi:hypothetical protein